MKTVILLCMVILTVIDTAHCSQEVSIIRAELVWVEHDDEDHEIRFSEFINGSWQTPKTIYSSEHHIATPTINTDADGNKTLLWSERTEQDTALMWTRKTQDHSEWQQAAVFTELDAENLSPSIVVDLSNKAWVFWSSNHEGLDDIYLSRQTNAGWSQPERVNSPNNVPDIQPQARLNEMGAVAVQWLSYDLSVGQYLTIERVFELDGAGKRGYKPIPDAVEERQRFDKIDPPDFLPRNTAAVLHIPDNQIEQSLRLDLIQ